MQSPRLQRRPDGDDGLTVHQGGGDEVLVHQWVLEGVVGADVAAPALPPFHGRQADHLAQLQQIKGLQRPHELVGVLAPDEPDSPLLQIVHLGRADWYPLDSVYDKVLKESQEMYFEIFEPDMTALAMTISTKGMYPPDKNLSGVIGKTQFAELTRFFAENGSKTPPFLLEKMRRIDPERREEIRREIESGQIPAEDAEVEHV